jgi:hypothetical protein
MVPTWPVTDDVVAAAGTVTNVDVVPNVDVAIAGPVRPARPIAATTDNRTIAAGTTVSRESFALAATARSRAGPIATDARAIAARTGTVTT